MLNAVRAPRFTPADEPALEAAAGNGAGPVHEAARAALEHLDHERSDAAYRARLAAETGLPVLDLPEVVTRRFDLAALGPRRRVIAGGHGGPGGDRRRSGRAAWWCAAAPAASARPRSRRRSP